MSEENCKDCFRKITERLYECLALDINCSYRFPFGISHYCSWLLAKHSDKSILNIPCCRENEISHQ
jgi:hypothetical protein